MVGDVLIRGVPGRLDHEMLLYTPHARHGCRHLISRDGTTIRLDSPREVNNCILDVYFYRLR